VLLNLPNQKAYAMFKL